MDQPDQLGDLQLRRRVRFYYERTIEATIELDPVVIVQLVLNDVSLDDAIVQAIDQAVRDHWATLEEKEESLFLGWTDLGPAPPETPPGPEPRHDSVGPSGPSERA